MLQKKFFSSRPLLPYLVGLLTSGDYFLMLYRTAGNGALTKFRSLNAQPADYRDDDLPPKSGTNLGYAIQVFFKDKRGRTRISDPVTIAIPPK
jgi:hypothetical protein